MHMTIWSNVYIQNVDRGGLTFDRLANNFDDSEGTGQKIASLEQQPIWSRIILP